MFLPPCDTGCRLAIINSLISFCIAPTRKPVASSNTHIVPPCLLAAIFINSRFAPKYFERGCVVSLLSSSYSPLTSNTKHRLSFIRFFTNVVFPCPVAAITVIHLPITNTFNALTIGFACVPSLNCLWLVCIVALWLFLHTFSRNVD